MRLQSGLRVCSRKPTWFVFALLTGDMIHFCCFDYEWRASEIYQELKKKKYFKTVRVGQAYSQKTKQKKQSHVV